MSAITVIKLLVSRAPESDETEYLQVIIMHWILATEQFMLLFLQPGGAGQRSTKWRDVAWGVFVLCSFMALDGFIIKLGAIVGAMLRGK